MITKEEKVVTFDSYCQIMYNHSPAFIVLSDEFKAVMYDSFIYNQKLQKPELTLYILGSKN